MSTAGTAFRTSYQVWFTVIGLLIVAGLVTGCGSENVPVEPPPPPLAPLSRLDEARIQNFLDNSWKNYSDDVFSMDPASPSWPGTPPYRPFLTRLANCSVDRAVLDTNLNLIEEMHNYQDYLHTQMQIPTRADQFAAGCKNVTTGITSQTGVSLGQLTNGNIALAITAWPYVSPDGVVVKILNNTGLVSEQDYPTITASDPNPAVFGVATADLNGDGNADMVVATGTGANTGRLSVFLGKADGSFTVGQTLSVPMPSGGSTAGPVIGFTIDDVNGDGKQDLIAITNAPSTDSGILVFLGNGDGTFASGGLAGPVGAAGQTAVTADFNGDGKKDIATSWGQILLGHGDGTFQLAAQSLPEKQRGLAAADFNQDGKIDLVFSNSTDSTIDVYYGSGDGTFTYSAAYPAIEGLQSVQSVDMDGDGYPDIFIGSATNGFFTIDANTGGIFQTRLNYGDGTFGKSRAYFNGTNGTPANADPTPYGVGAFTGGSTQDLVMVSGASGGAVSLMVLKGNGDGTFQTAGMQSPITGPADSAEVPGLAVGDVNNDGIPDVAFAWGSTNDSTTPHISIAIGKGDGTFQTQQDYSVPGYVLSGVNGVIVNPLLLTDVNGDGKPDLVFLASSDGSTTAPSLYLMLNNGTGSFGAAQQIDTRPAMSYLVAGDVNGDSKTDLLVTTGNPASSTAGTGLLYINNGNGTFKAASTLNPGFAYPVVATIADMDGDGKPDVIVAGNGSSGTTESIAVLLGNGDGTFQAAQTAAGPNDSPTGIVVFQATPNAKPDVLLSGSSPYLIPGNGDGTLDAADGAYLQLGINGKHLSTANLNGQQPPAILLTSQSAIDVFVPATNPAPMPGLTTTAVTASSASIASAAPVTLTATVTPFAASATGPSGDIIFFDGATNLGSASINGSGSATLTTQALTTTGTHTIVAAYGGDPNFFGSPSAPFTVTVGSVALAATTTTLTPSASTLNVGANLTLNATVAPSSGSGAPTGTVTFMDGTSTLGSGTLSSGAATYSTASLAAGTHSLTAMYGGDTNFAGSSSGAVSVTVQAPSPSFSISPSPSSASINAGQSAQTTLTVSPANGFNQQVSFTCSGLPVGGTCTFNPVTVTPSGSAAATTTLTIATVASSSALASPEGSSTRPGLLLAMAAGGILWMFRRRKVPAVLRLVLLLVVCVAAFVACGGSSSSVNKGQTQPQTYTVKITATAGSETQTANYSLTVQ